MGISIADPKSGKEREKVANKSCSVLGVNMICLVDSMDDRTNKAYGAWPERLYVIDKQGRIAVAGQPGPFGFAPSLKEANSWLSQKLNSRN